MTGPAWGEDAAADEPILARNVRALLAQLAADSGTRAVPDVTMTHAWHRAIYAGVSSVPGPHFLGAFRGSAHRDLRTYGVVIADGRGRVVAQTPPPAQVAARAAAFNVSLKQAVVSLDQLIPVGAKPSDAAQLEAVVTLCAVLHGEWVLLHPYANGNGRTARVWANWAGLRYGLPPFVRIKPRPDGLLYPRAAARSMGTPPDWQGDHRPTISLFLDLLRSRP